MTAVTRLKMNFAVKTGQTVQIFIHRDNDVPAPAAVAAVRAAARHMLLAAKTNHSIAAITAADINFCLIVKHNVITTALRAS
jgi:hypothetical protein